MMNERVKHLWLRAGFGVPLLAEEFRSEKELLDFLIDDAKKSIPLPGTTTDVAPVDFLKMTPEEKAGAVRKRAEAIRELNYDWYLRMASNKGVLREKMTLFWSNHFSCRSGSAVFTQQLNQIIREKALGGFGDLLMAVSKSPAMLQFLNNQQNRKSHPNENFAREVMELFTLGRGHYSEQDIQEAARAFTGWSFSPDGSFVFRERVHDEGVKTILGEKGSFKGEDVIKILLKQQQTAYFITQKFWKTFVSDQPEPEMIKKLSQDFFNSGYNILSLIRSVFESEWFYSSKYRGGLIKSPAELLVPLIRDFAIKFENTNVLLGFQKVLGQILFNPPNVAGWPGGRNWIDSSSLSVRMRVALVLLKNEIPGFDSKEDADANNPFREGMAKANVKSVSDWTNCIRKWSKTQENQLTAAIASWMLSQSLSDELIQLSGRYISGDSAEEKIRSTVMFLTTLPEYQMC